jgi:hypothetical protein
MQCNLVGSCKLALDDGGGHRCALQSADRVTDDTDAGKRRRYVCVSRQYQLQQWKRALGQLASASVLSSALQVPDKLQCSSPGLSFLSGPAGRWMHADGWWSRVFGVLLSRAQLSAHDWVTQHLIILLVCYIILLYCEPARLSAVWG